MQGLSGELVVVVGVGVVVGVLEDGQKVTSKLVAPGHACCNINRFKLSFSKSIGENTNFI